MSIKSRMSHVLRRGYAITLLLSLLTPHLLAQSAPNTIPYIIAQPTNQIAPVFGWTTLSVTAGGAAPLSYQWFFNGVPISHATNSSIMLGPLGYANSGYYDVIVSNILGQTNSLKAKLSVSEMIMSEAALSLYTNQYIFLQFTNLVDISGAQTYQTVTGLKADGMVVEYGVYGNPGRLVQPAVSNVVFLASPVGALQANGVAVNWGDPTPTVRILASNVEAMAGTGPSYWLLYSNATVAWSGALPAIVPGVSNIVSVAGGYSPPGYALQADGQVLSISTSGATNTGISNCVAISYSAPFNTLLALLADGTVIQQGNQLAIPFPGVSNIVDITTSWSLSLALAADGQLLSANSSPGALPPMFPCLMTNVFRMMIDPTPGPVYTLVGNGSPVVTVQPGNQFQPIGGTAWFHARAVGVQPMSYQWRLNGLNILDATNADLTITNLTANNYGAYQAIIRNRVASAATSVARLLSPISPTSILAVALNNTNLIWSTTGSANWFTESTYTHDGNSAAQSGAIGNGQQSILQTIVNGPGVLTFWWMVSSEEDFDFLEFKTNSALVAQISGQVGWNQQTCLIPATQISLQWIYSKDPSVSFGLDAAWLDQVSFTPTQPALLGLPQITAPGSLTFPVYNPGGASAPDLAASQLYFEASSDLLEWTPLTNVVVLTNGQVSVRDPDATNSPARFYRLHRQ